MSQDERPPTEIGILSCNAFEFGVIPNTRIVRDRVIKYVSFTPSD
jgi:hypothetical protein